MRRLAFSLALLLGSHTPLGAQECPQETPVRHLVVEPHANDFVMDPDDLDESLEMSLLDARSPQWTGTVWHTQLNQPTLVGDLKVTLDDDNVCTTGVCFARSRPSPRNPAVRPADPYSDQVGEDVACVGLYEVDLALGKFLRVSTADEEGQRVEWSWQDLGREVSGSDKTNTDLLPVSNRLRTIHVEVEVDAEGSQFRDLEAAVPDADAELMRTAREVEKQLCDDDYGYCSCVQGIMRFVRHSCYMQATDLPFKSLTYSAQERRD